MHKALAISAMALSAVVPASAQDNAPTGPPFDLADIDFERDCSPNPAMARLVGYLAGGDDGAVAAAISGDTHHELNFDAPVPWHGLDLRAVELRFGIERGPVNYTLHFSDAPDKVRGVPNRRSCKLPKADDRRDIAGPEGYAATGVITITRDEGVLPTGSWSCWRD